MHLQLASSTASLKNACLHRRHYLPDQLMLKEGRKEASVTGPLTLAQQELRVTGKEARYIAIHKDKPDMIGRLVGSKESFP